MASRGSTTNAKQAVGLLALFAVCHALIAVLAPPRLDVLSTLCVVIAAFAASGFVLVLAWRERENTRIFWILLVLSILLQACTHVAEAVAEVLQVPIANHASALIVFPSVLAMVPILLAVTLRWKPRRSTAVVKSTLAVAAGVLFFELLFDRFSVVGAPLQAAQTAVFYFDVADVLLSLTLLFRLAGAADRDEKRFLYLASLFYVTSTVCNSIHNHLLLRMDAVPLDLLLTAPFLILMAAALFPMPEAMYKYQPNGALNRIVRGANPVLLCLFVVAPAILLSRHHFVRGASGILAGVIGYGILNTLIHTQAMASEDELRDARTTLEEMVGLDALTGIANRRAFDRTLPEEWRRAKQNELSLTLLMVDVDYFKLLNDRYGHPYGDLCLERVASVLRSSLCRSTDFAARYGGEEFVVLLPQTPAEAARRIAERIRLAVYELSLEHKNSPFGRVTISIGSATSNTCDAATPPEFLEIADVALYMAKQHGRNRAEGAESIRNAVRSDFVMPM